MVVLAALLAQAGGALAQTPDTVVFGPKQYLRTSGAPNEFSDAFALPAGIGAPFQLQILNGAPNATNRISSARVTLNGTQIVGPSDFGQNVATITRTVTLGANNTLTSRLESTPGAYFQITLLGTRIKPRPTSLTPNPLALTVGAR